MSKTIASPLARKATLVAMQISQWTARKHDKRTTAKVARQHGAADDAGRYNKLLVQADRLKRINVLVSQARSLHYKYTKPWGDEGLRILPNTLHAKFAEEFRALKREFDEAADDFARDYPRYVEERKQSLNGLFDPADYPRPKDIRAKFKLAIKPMPVPVADDFRSDVLDEDTIDDIKRDIMDAGEDAKSMIARDTAEQIVDVVGHMSEKLSSYKQGGDEKNFFTASLVGNVRRLADLLPHFNLYDDPKLTRIINRIQSELCAEEADALRTNDKARETVKKSADEILASVQGFLS